jgi:hypothetical protein
MRGVDTFLNIVPHKKKCNGDTSRNLGRRGRGDALFLRLCQSIYLGNGSSEFVKDNVYTPLTISQNLHVFKNRDSLVGIVTWLRTGRSEF